MHSRNSGAGWWLYSRIWRRYSGIIRQQLKSGANQFNASFNYMTDNITFKSKDDIFDGEQRLGTTWWGYNEMSGVISGPIVDPKYRFFLNVNYVYNRDLNHSLIRNKSGKCC